MNRPNNPQPASGSQNTPAQKTDLLGTLYEFAEMIGTVTVFVLLLFAFVIRLNIVDGESMEQTLFHKEYLAVSGLFYEPEPGDIVIVHDINAYPYNNPIVKRVIATEGQTVDIDFETWTLTVDGQVIDEPYRYVDNGPRLTADYPFPVTVGEGEIFVLGDNRNHSADSRQSEIGMVDVRCVVGKAVARLSPPSRFTVFH
ncbi:MAG: signal peptidase I [Clostridia bacterium]|nr:signal peptidase I [Clostridia bacterium]